MPHALFSTWKLEFFYFMDNKRGSERSVNHQSWLLSRSWVATSGAHVSTQTFSVTRPATSCLPPLTELNSKQPENGVLIFECSQGKYPIPPNLVGQRVPYNVNTPEQYKPGMENAWTVSSTNKKIKVSAQRNAW